MNGNTTKSACREYSELKICLFSDLHYDVGQCMVTVEDMETILKRADDNKVDFVMQCGDFCGNYIGSPELLRVYLDNRYDLPVYGVYGNHELQGLNNSASFVTPKLTNRNGAVVWGTEDGKISPDGSVAYYYFDCGGFRIICTDTNYSYNPTGRVWEHNQTCSVGPPKGNVDYNALGPEQMRWLETVLTDAAEKDIPCIIVCHASFNSEFADSSCRADEVMALFDRINAMHPRTVIAEFSGHAHLDRMEVRNNIVFLNINTVRNGYWALMNGQQHYHDETFLQTVYDDDGNALNAPGESTLLSSLIQGANTWFYDDALSCIVRLTSDGRVSVKGMQSEWLNHVVPPMPGNPKVSDYLKPMISTAEFDLNDREE